MRAEASSASPFCFRRQSQRLTRRSSPANFHPVPPQTGQTSEETFIKEPCFHFALLRAVAQVPRPEALCRFCGGKDMLVDNSAETDSPQGHRQTVEDLIQPPTR